MSPDSLTLPPLDRSRDEPPGPYSRPNGLDCLVPDCDGTPYNDCVLCPPHQRFWNAFREWLWHREFDDDRNRNRLIARP